MSDQTFNRLRDREIAAARPDVRVETELSEREQLLARFRGTVDLGFQPPSVSEIADIAQQAGVSVRVLCGLED